MKDNFWFSDIAQADQEPYNEAYPWQPCAQLDGFCLSLDIWYATKDECDAFIQKEIVGLGWEA